MYLPGFYSLTLFAFLIFVCFFTFLYSTPFLTEDGLLDMIRSSKPAKIPVQEEIKKRAVDKTVGSQTKESPQKKVKGMLKITLKLLL